MTTQEREALDPNLTEDRGASELGPRELVRWALRSLTTMRTALFLLFLLAVAAAPGSFVPQNSVDPQQVASWRAAHPDISPLFDRLSLFNVYGSPWFSAIYILLMASLIGCVIPRLTKFVRALIAPTGLTMKSLPTTATLRTVDVWPGSSSTFLERTATALRRRGFKVRISSGNLVAEGGHARELGNLLFHASILVVLLGFAYGKLYGFTGAVVIVEGQTFANNASRYDNLLPGARFGPDDLTPLSLKLDKFDASYLPSGQPQSFTADVTFRDDTNGRSGQQRLEVNRPLSLTGADFFLIGHGYAPVITVTDGQGQVTYSGPTVFLPLDSALRSYGVIKAPDAQPNSLAFDGEFYPTVSSAADGSLVSAFPGLGRPQLALTYYEGDLGLDSGNAQNVYTLDQTGLAKREEFTLDPGQTVALAGGAGSVRFDGVLPWARLQVGSSPGDRVVLAGVIVGLGGLLVSLFARRRRIFIRATPHDAIVEVASLVGRRTLLDDPQMTANISRWRDRRTTPRKSPSNRRRRP
jgi:cytochrome c biogenesis protein